LKPSKSPNYILTHNIDIMKKTEGTNRPSFINVIVGKYNLALKI